MWDQGPFSGALSGSAAGTLLSTISLTKIYLREKVKELQVELSWSFQNPNRAPKDLFTKWNNFLLRQRDSPLLQACEGHYSHSFH